jgi:peroxiredoxin
VTVLLGSSPAVLAQGSGLEEIIVTAERREASLQDVSDFNKEISPAYGAMYDVFSVNLRGVSKRAAFVIDKEGVIRYAEVLENAKHLPNFDAISRTLSELK